MKKKTMEEEEDASSYFGEDVVEQQEDVNRPPAYLTPWVLNNMLRNLEDLEQKAAPSDDWVIVPRDDFITVTQEAFDALRAKLARFDDKSLLRQQPPPTVYVLDDHAFNLLMRPLKRVRVWYMSDERAATPQEIAEILSAKGI
jgi:hypothetical protein